MIIRTMLVPCDFSGYSTLALDQAVELGEKLGAKLVLLHSYWVSVSTVAGDYWVVPPDFRERLREGAGAELEKLRQRAQAAGVACEIRLAASPPVEAILEAAEALPADLIVMGTHGHTGLKHVVLGSTAERIVRLAPCAVLTVKESKKG